MACIDQRLEHIIVKIPNDMYGQTLGVNYSHTLKQHLSTSAQSASLSKYHNNVYRQKYGLRYRQYIQQRLSTNVWTTLSSKYQTTYTEQRWEYIEAKISNNVKVIALFYRYCIKRNRKVLQRVVNGLEQLRCHFCWENQHVPRIEWVYNEK